MKLYLLLLKSSLSKIDIKTFETPLLVLKNETFDITGSILVEKEKLQSIEISITVGKDKNISKRLLKSDTDIDNAVFPFEFNHLTSSKGAITLKLKCKYSESNKDDFTLEKSNNYYMPWGITTLLPIVVVLFSTYFLKNSLLSLALGVYTASTIVNKWNPFIGFLRMLDVYVVNALFDKDYIKIILFTFFLSGFIALVQKSGGAKALVIRIVKFSNNRFRGLLATFMFAFIVFFDEFSTILIVGPNMLPVTDALNISREKLSLIVHSLASPLVVLWPISSWIGFELGLINNSIKEFGLTKADSYTNLIKSIPSRFFPIFFISLIFISILTKKEITQYMAKPELEAYNKVGVIVTEAVDEDQILKPNENVPYRSINAILPIILLISFTIAGMIYTGLDNDLPADGEIKAEDYFKRIAASGDILNSLLYSAFLCTVLCLISYKAQSLMNLSEAVTAFLKGIQDIIEVNLILIFAWAFQNSIRDLLTATYVINTISPIMSVGFIPIVTFALTWFISYVIGSSWGTCTVAYPILLPFAAKLAKDAAVKDLSQVLVTMISTIMTGAVLGEQMSPIGGINILVSGICKLPLQSHLNSQLGYVLVAAIYSVLFGYIPQIFIPFEYQAYSNLGFLAFGLVSLVPYVYFFGIDIESGHKGLVQTFIGEKWKGRAFWSKKRHEIE